MNSSVHIGTSCYDTSYVLGGFEHVVDEKKKLRMLCKLSA